MRVTILGSNGTYPTPSRPTSGYLIQQEGTTVWMDTGSGTFAALQTVTDFAALDAVIVSHVHADHCLDLPGFYHAIRYGAHPGEAIPTYVPDGFVEQLTGFLGSSSISDTLDFRVQTADDQVSVGGIDFRFAVTDHPVPTLAIRATATNRVLAYSADTGPAGEWAEIATEADLFICEATYQGRAEDKVWPHHLTAGEAGEIARRVGVQSLILTHIWPALDPGRSVQEAEETFGRPVRLAVPGMALDV